MIVGIHNTMRITKVIVTGAMAMEFIQPTMTTITIMGVTDGEALTTGETAVNTIQKTGAGGQSNEAEAKRNDQTEEMRAKEGIRFPM